MTKREAAQRLAWSTPERRQQQAERGRKGGCVSGKKAREKARKRYQAMGLPLPAAMEIRRVSYGSGYTRGKRVGFAEGYEQALRDLEMGRVA